MRFLNKEIDYKIMLLISGIIGVVVFLFIYGAEVLDVTNERWLINGAGDLSAHHIGWLYYRDAPWQFPIGLQEGITYPYKFSVLYMDSIPIFALLFKILSPFLPVAFQYFGLYGLFTYVLQAVLGCILVYNLTQDTKASVIGSAFFTMSSVMLQRMFGHSALAFHPLILLAMICYFNRENIIKKNRDVVYWSLMLSLACSVQAYFVPMIFAFMAAFYLPEIISKKWYKGCIKIVIPTAVTVVIMYIWGYFYGSHDLNGGGLGSFNANINALFNDQGNSLVSSLMGKTASGGIWESYAYLGAGILILSVIALYDIIQKKKYKELKKQNRPLVILIVIFLFVSIYPVIRFGEYTLLELPLPQSVDNLFGTFRANGRFMWPVMYLAILGVIVYIIRNFREKACLFLMVCLLIQILDLSPACKAQSERINILTETENRLSSDAWEQMNRKEVFFFYEPVGGAPMEITSLMGKYAHDHGMVMNDFYTSRKDSTNINQDKNEEYQNIMSGNPDKNKLYVFNEIPLEILANASGLHFYTIDGISVGITEELPGQEEISIKYGVDLALYSSSTVTNGIKDESGTHIYKDGVLNASYPLLPTGTYQMTFSGDNLDNILIHAGKDNGTIQMEEISKTDEMICVQFTLDQENTNITVNCQNNGQGDVLLKSLVISADK